MTNVNYNTQNCTYYITLKEHQRISTKTIAAKNSENSVNMGVYENFFFYFQRSEKTTIAIQKEITYYFSRFKGGPNHVETFVNIL